MSQSNDAGTAFHDLDAYQKLRRVNNLHANADGTRLIAGVSELDPKGTGYRTQLWEIDPQGVAPSQQLTSSTQSAQAQGFLADGSFLFTSSRPDPGKEEDQDSAALFRLPLHGEAHPLSSRTGGISGAVTHPESSDFVVVAPRFPEAETEEADAKLRKDRKEKKVSAIVHEGYPVRFWDHDVPADSAQLFSLEDGELRWITEHSGKAFFEEAFLLSPDGTTIYAVHTRQIARGDMQSSLVKIDVSTGHMTELLSAPGMDYHPCSITSDGTTLSLIVTDESTTQSAPNSWLATYNLPSGTLTEVAKGWDRWPASAQWVGGRGEQLLVTANEGGREPLFVVEVASGAVRRITDDGAYTDVSVDAAGHYAYALRYSYEYPAEPVRVELATGEVVRLQSPAPRPALPGRLEEVTATSADGVPLRAWLAVPEQSGPHPLLLWVHGGPLMSWNGWSWRWNPWLMVARGYAVLLPDPRLSDGYGQDFIQAGWGRWGKEPFTDLMTITDAAIERSDIDSTRTAAMGGSFGGYMANWIAGHTDRFKAIVTHASLWNLPAFSSTTDFSVHWSKELSPEMSAENSPHLAVESISTPMLVIHGDKDYRVPISEGLGLWYDLISKSALAMDDDGQTPHRFLYFPDEAHWVLKPENSKVWYRTVFDYLGHHVLEEEQSKP